MKSSQSSKTRSVDGYTITLHIPEMQIGGQPADIILANVEISANRRGILTGSIECIISIKDDNHAHVFYADFEDNVLTFDYYDICALTDELHEEFMDAFKSFSLSFEKY